MQMYFSLMSSLGVHRDLVGVGPWEDKEHSKIESEQDCEKPVKIVKMASIEVIHNPAIIASSSCHKTNNTNDGTA